jgi:hypothetical protein
MSGNQNFLSTDQNLSQYKDLESNKATLNFQNLNHFHYPLPNPRLNLSYLHLKSQNINPLNFYKLTSIRTTIQPPYNPLLGANLLTSSLDYDLAAITKASIKPLSQNSLLNTLNLTLKKTNIIHLLRGKRDGAPGFLNTSY